MNRLVELLSAIDGGRVLDVATGEGEFATLLVEHLRSYTTVVGVDIDENLLASAIRTYGSRDVRFRVADARRLPFSDERFDMVTVSNALHHFAEPGGVLKEMTRVLVPAGTMLLKEMVADRLSPAQQTVADLHAIKAEVDRSLGISHGPTLARKAISSLVARLPVRVERRIVYQPILEQAGPEAIAARFEFIEAYLRHLSSDQEHYARLRRAMLRVKEQVYRVGIEAPPELVIQARKRV
ncbi:class I SAM-dependent methyltransferase [Salinispira pacifica]